MPCGDWITTNVPDESLADVIQECKDNDPPPLSVTTSRAPDGTNIVVAHYPPCGAKPTGGGPTGQPQQPAAPKTTPPQATGPTADPQTPAPKAAPDPQTPVPKTTPTPATPSTQVPGPAAQGPGHVSTEVAGAAQRSQQTWDILSSISIAQWALESGWGKHMPPGSNNPFGIKAVGDQPFVAARTTEYGADGRPSVIEARFRAFATLADAFDQHGRLLATSSAYASARMYRRDAAKFASALTGVYATDPNYGSALFSLIKGFDLEQYDGAAMPATPLTPAAPEAPLAQGARVQALVAFASDPVKLSTVQAIAARKLLAYDGEIYPTDGCAITLSLLLQQSGFAVPDTFQALAMGRVLRQSGWTEIAIGSQQPGDVGSTCGATANHGQDHVYLVLTASNADEMVIADNQAQQPHFRFASGKGRAPTTFFLRPPDT